VSCSFLGAYDGVTVLWFKSVRWRSKDGISQGPRNRSIESGNLPPRFRARLSNVFSKNAISESCVNRDGGMEEESTTKPLRHLSGHDPLMCSNVHGPKLNLCRSG